MQIEYYLDKSTMLRALSDSVEHWYDNLMLALSEQLVLEDANARACPCCQQAKVLGERAILIGAPLCSYCNYCILKHLGHCGDGCKGSPYSKFRDALDSGNWESIINSVINEINWLDRSMLLSKGVWGELKC